MKNRITKQRFRKRLIPSIIVNILIFVLVAFVFQIDKIPAFSEAYDQLAPRTPADLSISIGKNEATITWNENIEADLFGYAIYVRTGEEKEAKKPIIVGKTDKYVIKDLNENKSYYVSVAARDKDKNESDKTEEIGFTPDGESLKNFKVTGWMQASADLKEARESFIDNVEVFSSLSPFWYSAQGSGNIEQRGQILNDEVSQEALENKVGIIPTITNNYDKDGATSALLKDDTLIQTHVDVIMSEVQDNNFAGIDIDYENLDASVNKQFTKFIQKLADRLHKEDKVLSVTVQAKRSDGNTWSGAGAMDFKKLGAIVDQFRVMTYDYSRVNTAPGPIAPAYWMEEVIEYAKSKVPKEKIYVGIPFYAYQWCTSGDSDTCTNKGLTWEGVNNIQNKYDPILEWDDDSKAPWFMYIDDDNNTKIVYYENRQSIETKLDIVKDLDVGGIAIWRLGSENPENYKVIKEKLGSKVKPPARLHIEPTDEKIKVSWQKDNDENIKGYRIFIKEKIEEEEVLEDDEELKLAEILEKYHLESSISSRDAYDEEYVDIYDENDYTFENLNNDSTYYISVMSLAWKLDLDELDLSDEEIANRTSAEVIVTPADLYYPKPIDDVFVENIGSSTLDLSWLATGDDVDEGQATNYDIRFSKDEINEYNFDEAYEYEHTPEPNESGEKQFWQIRGLEPGGEYYVAIKAEDESGNKSDLSNVIKIQTIDNIPPRTPEIPSAQALDSEIFISWNENEEEDVAGYKLYWKKEGSDFNVVDLDSANRHYSILNLENNANYHVSLLAYDTSGNESLRSEDVVIMPEGQGGMSKYSAMFGKYGAKLQGALSIFAGRLFNEKAIPFIVVLSVLVINYFIFQGIKREIHKKPGVKVESKATNPRPGRVVDLKNIRRVIK